MAVYPPPTCYKCGAIGPDVRWREFGPNEAIPTCERHKPLLVAFRDFEDACADAGRAFVRAFEPIVNALGEFTRRYGGGRK